MLIFIGVPDWVQVKIKILQTCLSRRPKKRHQLTICQSRSAAKSKSAKGNEPIRSFGLPCFFHQSFLTLELRCPRIDISEVTKSHPKGDDDIEFSID